MFKKIASNTIAQVISKILTAIISIFLLSILTKYLSIEWFWLYSKIFNYLWIFAFLADLWLYTIMIREISEKNNKKDIEKIVWNVLSLRVWLWIIIIFLALIIAYFLPWYNSYLELLSIFIIWIFTLISLMNSTFLAYMQSQLKMEFSLFSVVAGKILNLSLVLLIVYIFITNSWENSIIFIFISALIWIILNTILNFWYANKSTKIRFKFDTDYIKYIFRISLPYWIALFLSVIYFKLDIVLLSILEWDKADISIALYSLPMKIIEVLMVISWFYLNSVLPKISELFEKEKGQTQDLPLQKNYRGKSCVHPENNFELQKLLVISFKILFSFWIIVLTLWTLFRNNVIEIIGNSNYLSPTNHIYSSSDAFLIVLAVLLFNAISLLFIYIFIAAKKQSILLKINIFITLFNIIWNIILIPKYSFLWAWIITLISQALLFIISYYYSRKIIKFSFPKKFIFKIIFLSVIIFFIVNYLLQNYSMWLYLDILVYGFSFTWIYGYLVFREIKK